MEPHQLMPSHVTKVGFKVDAGFQETTRAEVTHSGLSSWHKSEYQTDTQFPLPTIKTGPISQRVASNWNCDVFGSEIAATPSVMARFSKGGATNLT